MRTPGASGTDSVLNLGALRFSETAAFGSPWAWLRGDTLLVYGMNQWPVASYACAEAELVPVNGNRIKVAQFPCRPGHPATAADGSLLAIESGLLVRHARTADGWGVSEPLTERAALYPTAALDGSLLYVGPDGLHLRARNNRERRLGWPITFQAPRAPPLLLRNVLPDALLSATSDGVPFPIFSEGEAVFTTERRVTFGASPGSQIEFPLAPPDARALAPFEFIEFADVQEAIGEVSDVFEKMNQESSARFVTMAGDLTRNGSVEELERCQLEQARLRLPGAADTAPSAHLRQDRRPSR